MTVFVAPILLGLGSFFLIPLVLVGVAVVPLAIVTGIVMLLIAWHRSIDSTVDRPRRRPQLPLTAVPHA